MNEDNKIKNKINEIFGLLPTGIIKQESGECIEKSIVHENSLYCDTDIIFTIATYEKFEKYQEELNNEIYSHP